jgi:DNA-binding NarL/FixJ family response regulator
VADYIRIFLVEDDDDWLRGLSNFLSKEKDIFTVGEATCGHKAIKLVKNLDIDVVLIDYSLANSINGIQTAEQIIKISNSKVIMLTSLEEQETIFDAYKIGVIDYIFKTDFEEIPEAIRAAYQNKSPIRPSIAEKLRREFTRLKEFEKSVEIEKWRSILTQSEILILEYLSKGYTQSKIAQELTISIHTVKIHVGKILKKFGEKRSKDVVTKARELEIIK